MKSIVEVIGREFNTYCDPAVISAANFCPSCWGTDTGEETLRPSAECADFLTKCHVPALRIRLRPYAIPLPDHGKPLTSALFLFSGESSIYAAISLFSAGKVQGEHFNFFHVPPCSSLGAGVYYNFYYSDK